MRAVLAAVNAAKPGVVRVAAADATLARQCREFILAFLATDKLKPLFLKATGDEIGLRSGVIITVDSNVARLSHGAISVIELAWGPSSDGDDVRSPLKEHADDEVWMARAAMHCISHWLYTGEGYDSALMIAALFDPDDPAGWLEQQKREHLAEIENCVPMSSGLARAAVQENAPGLASAYRPHTPSRADYVASPEFEKDRAERMGMAELRNDPTSVIGG